MPTPDAGLEVRDLTASAGSFQLGPVDLTVPANRVLVILGPSGAGKTVLLTAIGGLRQTLSGRVRLAGSDVTRQPPEKRRIGMVFQDGALFPHLTVRENISFGPRVSGAADLRTADALLAQLGIVHLADRVPRTLSGGERQRVALARALAIQPRLLLLDEPLSALDQPTREEMRELLRNLLSQQPVPAVHVTHDRDEALTLADDLAILASGTIRQAGEARQIAADPADPLVARLLGWSELGRGVRAHGQIRVGDITVPAGHNSASADVRVFYRPEEVLLQTPGTSPASPGSLRSFIRRMDLTFPLARVTLASTPAVTALCLHRQLEQLGLRVGSEVDVMIPSNALRSFSENGGAAAEAG